MAKQVMTKEGIDRVEELREHYGIDINSIIKTLEREMKASIQSRKNPPAEQAFKKF